MEELSKFRKFLNENKEPINEANLDDILAQIENMAFNGEIESGADLAKAVTKAVRNGKIRLDKSKPDYADRMAARNKKAAATKAANAADAEQFRQGYVARQDKKANIDKERMANNQLPLEIGNPGRWGGSSFTRAMAPMMKYYILDKNGISYQLKDQYVDEVFSPEIAKKGWEAKYWKIRLK